MYKYLFLGALPLAVATVLLLQADSHSVTKTRHAVSPQTQAGKGFAIVELFTSQGCSSCPPADALLGKLAMEHDEQVLPIAFHVDYWNRLGWKEPFSNPRYSQRQRNYASQFNLDGVYTPQAVVNGKRQMVGSDAHLLAAAIMEAKATAPIVNISIVALSQQADSINIQYTIAGADNGATLHAVLVQEQVETDIKAGENKGLSLNNYCIARDIQTTSATSSGKLLLSMPRPNTDAAFSVVLFVQQDDGKIVGATKKKLR